MTFTGRIRLFLILVALLPPLAVIGVAYYHLTAAGESHHQRLVQQSLTRYQLLHQSYLTGVQQAIERLCQSPLIRRASILMRTGHPADIDLRTVPPGLDFLEIIDSTGVIRASHHRPGLLGESLAVSNAAGVHNLEPRYTVEYDLSGRHASLSYDVPLEDGVRLYTGRYLDAAYLEPVALLLDAKVSIAFADSAAPIVTRMTPGELYAEDNQLQAVLAGDKAAGFYVVAKFNPGGLPFSTAALFGTTGLVAAGAVVLAVILGIILTGRAKREIDNLTQATARVAQGDLQTPVMAYEEGEFAQLADAFTEMTFKLRRAQRDLAVSERIAAWQTMGRKIAHEIKNPLTPIAIGADDLHRSYQDSRDDFDRVLKETTATIKRETQRLARLLDEFVSFARMAPPEFTTVAPDEFVSQLASLYRAEIENGRLIINIPTELGTARFDPEKIQQVLINLIKNGLEAGDGPVTLSVAGNPETVTFTIDDSGPGFPQAILDLELTPYFSTKEGGSGLGLVICQRIVYDHSGSLEFENHPDGGRVTVQLPRDHGQRIDY